jgi:hypothetical protein
MFPIPPPDRLVPRPLGQRSGSSRAGSWGEVILSLGAVPLPFISGIAGAYLVGDWARTWQHWLTIPGGLVGLVLGLVLAMTLLEQSMVLRGVIEAAFYSTAAFVLSGGLDLADPSPSWTLGGAVAALFLISTFAAWRSKRK